MPNQTEIAIRKEFVMTLLPAFLWNSMLVPGEGSTFGGVGR